MNSDIQHDHYPRSRAVFRICLSAFLAIVAFFLWTEHRAHLFGALPYLLLLLCPAMHLFMHHGHGGALPHHDGADR